VKVVVAFVVLAACGARTELASVDASAIVGDAACDAQCEAGEICIHQYGTHDPPPPLKDGGTCTGGIQRFDRCWSENDRCTTPPPNCSTDPCTCPPLDPTWPEGCACSSDGTFDCYDIGI
jgi:hypothetical protein